MSFREVNDDILKELWEYRDQTEFAYMTKEDKKHIGEYTQNVIREMLEKNKPLTEA